MIITRGIRYCAEFRRANVSKTAPSDARLLSVAIDRSQRQQANFNPDYQLPRALDFSTRERSKYFERYFES